MEVLETLSVALGLATLAGINLYLVVLLAGLAIRYDWVALADRFPDLAVLGEGPVLCAAAIFFCLEFFSDKVPWVDSAWDSIHTLIRPLGGSFLALAALGPMNAEFEVILALLFAGTTLMSHGLKSGTRLAVNTSPEPASNTIVSLGEDVAVAGGLSLMAFHPLWVGSICLIFVAACLYLVPKGIQKMRAGVKETWSKVLGIGRSNPSS